ncbi:MAG: hypothetical protein ACYCPQ_05340 [Elusimicrobiota bacterium]
MERPFIESMKSGRKALFGFLCAAGALVVLEAFFRIYYRVENGRGAEKLAFRSGFQNMRVKEVRSANGTAYYETNQAGSEFRSSHFRKIKEPDTVRLCFLGESAVWGANYVEPINFPHAVNLLLNSLVPGRAIEVVNAALPGIDSLRVLDIAERMIRYHPDIFVVYMGNNEFYRTPPVLEVGVNDMIYRLTRWSALYYYLFKLKYIAAVRDQEGYRDFYRHLNYAGFEAANFSYFEYRLRRLIALCRKNRIKLVLCTVAANEGDWPPPDQTFFSRNLAPEDKAHWRAVLAKADGDSSAGRCDRAIPLYASASRIVLEGGAQYRYGRCLFALGRYAQARRQFQLADLYSDGRIKPEMNALIRRVAKAGGIPLVDIDRAARARSPHGIIGFRLADGREFLDDDVHLSIYGQYFVAKRICQELYRDGVIAPKSLWRWNRMMSFPAYMDALHPSPQDLEISYTMIAEIVMQRNIPRGMHFVNKALRINPRDARAMICKGVGDILSDHGVAGANLIRAALRQTPDILSAVHPFYRRFVMRRGYARL